MQHLAILRKSNIKKGDNLLKDILDGAKTIESRWYVNKISPWNKIKAGETVYFKESGCSVTAKATVNKVLQFQNLIPQVINDIIKKYGKQISPHTSTEKFLEWGKKQNKKRYCVLVFLKDVKKVKPFDIDKTGYGISSAWLSFDSINDIKK